MIFRGFEPQIGMEALCFQSKCASCLRTWLEVLGATSLLCFRAKSFSRFFFLWDSLALSQPPLLDFICRFATSRSHSPRLLGRAPLPHARILPGLPMASFMASPPESDAPAPHVTVSDEETLISQTSLPWLGTRRTIDTCDRGDAHQDTCETSQGNLRHCV